MEMEEEEERGKVRALIEKAINSTAAEVDPRLLKAIKSVVRFSDSELRLAANTLMELMKRDHSQVRFLALLVIDELFMRSKLFRTLLVENLDNLLALSVGFRRTLPLPAPPAIASVLRSKAIEFLEKWNDSFGVHYRQLRLGFDYLKNTLRFQFPNLQANAARMQQERRERERRTQEILKSKFEELKENFVMIKEEIQSTVDEIVGCLDIARMKKENLPLVPLDDEDSVEFYSSELQQIRLQSIKEGEKVHENSDNKVVFDALRELYKVLVTKHMVSVQEGISLLIKVDVTDNRSRDSMLKELIDIRNRLLSMKKDCEEAGCYLPKSTNNDNEEEEVNWVEAEVESTETKSSMEPRASMNNENLSAAQNSKEGSKIGSIERSSSGRPGKQNEDPARASTSKNSKKVIDKGKRSSNITFKTDKSLDIETSSLKNKLLAEAPVVDWGPQLDNWGPNRDVLANQRGLDLDNHWGRVELDAVIPGKIIAELNLQATIYKEEPVDIEPCRAPLSKGGLCQRRDIRVCPFHGPIIPRDDEGKPIIDNNSSTTERSLKLEPDIAEELAKQAVKNIRGKDKEEVRKRKNEKNSLKRAKLAKVREHNDDVLRDAAFASTSMSEALDQNREGSSRQKKQTLASMVREKVTRRDRLAQKLLNTRTTDASARQLTIGDDATYRDAFTNQW